MTEEQEEGRKAPPISFSFLPTFYFSPNISALKALLLGVQGFHFEHEEKKEEVGAGFLFHASKRENERVGQWRDGETFTFLAAVRQISCICVCIYHQQQQTMPSREEHQLLKKYIHAGVFYGQGFWVKL